MTTVSPPYVPLVSINHHSMKDLRDSVRAEAELSLAAGMPRRSVVALWMDRATWWLSLRGVTQSSLERFVRNLRPNRDPRREALRKKWYAARQRVVIVGDQWHYDYWMLIPAKNAPVDGTGDHVGVFRSPDRCVSPSVFENSGQRLHSNHTRLYSPFCVEMRKMIPDFSASLAQLKQRYLMIAEANPSDPRL
jgi:hypothetical protein